MLRPLVQNKFRERQISRVSDFEIKVVVRYKENFAIESLDRGNFIRHRNFFEALIARELSDLIASIVSRNDDDFADGIGQLERVDGMRDHRFTGHYLE